MHLIFDNMLWTFIPAIQCASPNNPENGRAVFASVSYNSLISYECNYGYMIVGDQVS